jgi:predicted alpha/beta-fold hydrolase
VPRYALRGGHLQTVVSHFLPRNYRLPICERRLIRVEPDVDIQCLCHWQPERRSAVTLVIVHGLEGSSESQYVLGTAAKAWSAGMNVVRMNVRNCGGTESLCPTLYHSGMSGDIAEVVRQLVDQESLSSVALAGFSMGGNQVLKLAGEWGTGEVGPLPPQVFAVTAVSPAMDLSASADALHKFANRLYELRFLLSLRARVRRKRELYPDRFHIARLWWTSIRDFDNTVTAPHCGFRDADDYYERASSSRVIDRISVPTLIIHANDDPFIRVLPETRAKLRANSNITYVETEHGGHCGFLGASSGNYDGRWAEQQIVNFIVAQRGLDTTADGDDTANSGEAEAHTDGR